MIQSRCLAFEAQKTLLDELVASRAAIATELRQLWQDADVDLGSLGDSVQELSARYGEIDGQLVSLYAAGFDDVYESLTDEQVSAVWALRESSDNLGLTDDPCSLSAGNLAYLYSEPTEMPEGVDSSRFFTTTN